MPKYTVEVGRDKGRYKRRYAFEGDNKARNQAIMYFKAINVWHGYKKRLREDGKTIARVITQRG